MRSHLLLESELGHLHAMEGVEHAVLLVFAAPTLLLEGHGLVAARALVAQIAQLLTRTSSAAAHLVAAAARLRPRRNDSRELHKACEL